MGPRLISRGESAAQAASPPARKASMGPRLISRGENAAQRDYLSSLAASMGPRLISRGEATGHCLPRREQCGFNGATADQPWRVPRWVVVSLVSGRFNGATADQPWRARQTDAAFAQPVASMGPRLISRGENPKNDGDASFLDASMGPRLISRGETSTTTLTLTVSMASMGPRLISRGERQYRTKVPPTPFELQWGHG